MGKFTPPKNLILSPSGMRGILGDSLTPEVILKFCEAFGTWLKLNKGFKCPKVLVGMDTRTTGPLVKNISLGALQSVGCEIIDADICPTPALLFGHKYYDAVGTVIISASHNPPMYNGMKCLAPSGTFLSREELDEIKIYFEGEKPNSYVNWMDVKPIQKSEDLVLQYRQRMKKFLNLALFNSQKSNPLKVIVDPGAGAGTGVTASILTELGCDVTEINTHLDDSGNFPREFEPIKPHLSLLSLKMKELGATVGFAHDCDADRVSLIGEDGTIYPEDIILGLIVEYILQSSQKSSLQMDSIILVTNCASSLVLDDLAEKYHTKIYHTPVGERYLAEKMNILLEENDIAHNLIFGGEGSCGGFMLPEFNNTRDGIFAAVKICELLLESGKKISELVKTLPEYFSVRKKISLNNGNALKIMGKIKDYLQSSNISYESIDNDVKILGDHEWTLVHPSNTEPIIRIITEAKTLIKAQALLEKMDSMIHSL